MKFTLKIVLCSVVACLFAVLTAAPSFAVFSFEEKPQVESEEAVPDESDVVVADGKATASSKMKYDGVIQVGEGMIEVIVSEGDKIPLNKALKMIAPKGWRIFYDTQVNNTETKVSWDGRDKPWVEVLSPIARELSLKFAIEYQRRKLFVIKNSRTDEQIIQMKNIIESSASKGTNSPKPELKTPQFILQKGDFSPQLKRLCKQYGYHLEWDYPREVTLKSGVKLSLPFKQCLQLVVQELRSNGSRVWIKSYNVDRTIRVVEK